MHCVQVDMVLTPPVSNHICKLSRRVTKCVVRRGKSLDSKASQTYRYTHIHYLISCQLEYSMKRNKNLDIILDVILA